MCVCGRGGGGEGVLGRLFLVKGGGGGYERSGNCENIRDKKKTGFVSTNLSQKLRCLNEQQ